MGLKHVYHFIDGFGSFTLEEPQQISYLYFPLVNEAGLVSSVTPSLHGDIKAGQHAYLTPPVSVEDLHNSRWARNFWVKVKGEAPWSATGNSAAQIAASQTDHADRVMLEAGFLWHRIKRVNQRSGLQAEILNFIPASEDRVELMHITLVNTGSNPLELTPTAAIPIYGRSADNLRDHRHVTSLLQRIYTTKNGVLVRPTLSFDERGHQPSNITYAALGIEEDGAAPSGFFPTIALFSGEGGCLDWPAAVLQPGVEIYPEGTVVEGYEAMGGLRFADVVLGPGEKRSYVLILAILQDQEKPEDLVLRYGGPANLAYWMDCTQKFWQVELENLEFETPDADYNRWLRWVTWQPVLRRMIGNSFLPYHDYGRGGRGWRDLWQDCLALLIMEPESVPDILHSSFAGVRMDGSNATIIGTHPGEFKADRNNIPRVWMDHGAWPFLTTAFYIQQSGDLEFLLREQVYFKDQLTHRGKNIDDGWTPEQGTVQKTRDGRIYSGSLLEHLLVQHLVAFFHVGEHNNLLLEGADWNDGMDMARRKGESVAFTCLYASNLLQLSQLLLQLEENGVTVIELAEELLLLLDTLKDRVGYADPAAKQRRLTQYFDLCQGAISGKKVRLPTQAVSADLAAKGNWMVEHLRQQEWIQNRDGYAWFNGYYDDDGNRVEGDHPLGVRMTLTGQVFALMGGIATDEQARQIARSADRYLLDWKVGGFRLNTNFGEVPLNLGRCFGYAYGHKENGAMFSHMAVMYANALYRRGLVKEGYAVLTGIYKHCQNFSKSRMYPGIPEYVDPQGRGMYPYLTGSASWYLLTLLTEAFGVHGVMGDMALEPRLLREQFGETGQAGLLTLFAGKNLRVVYHNPDKLEYGEYTIGSIHIDGKAAVFRRQGPSAILRRADLEILADAEIHRFDVELIKDGS